MITSRSGADGSLRSGCLMHTNDELPGINGQLIQDSNGHSHQVARWQVLEIILQLYLDPPKGKPLHGDLFKDYPIKI